MTTSNAFKVFRAMATLSAVTVAAVVEAAPIVRDHRAAPTWQPDLGKNKKAIPDVRDHRSVPVWNPIRQPVYKPRRSA